jgi:methyl-accepting chemotaxis protein
VELQDPMSAPTVAPAAMKEYAGRSLTLAAKMALLSGGVAVALAAGLTTLGYQKAEAGLQRKSVLALGAEALLNASQVETWAGQRIDTVQSLSGLRTLRRLLETSAAPAPDDVDAANLVLFDAANITPDVIAISLIDRGGRVVASSTETDERQVNPDLPAFQSALGGKPYLSGVQLGGKGEPFFEAAAPVLGSNGAVIGAVRSRALLAHVDEVARASRARLGGLGQVVFLDPAGHVMASTVPGQEPGRPAPALSPAGQRTVFDWSAAGAPFLAIAEPLPRLRWTAVVGLPTSEVHGEAGDFLRSALLGALIGVAVAVFLSVFVARRAVRSVRLLTKVSSQVVADNDLTHDIQITSGDEIGRLAQSFALMVGALRHALQTLQESSRSLLQAADELRRTTEEGNELVARQATALQETQVTAQEIKQTSLMTAQKVAAVLETAEQAEEVGRVGEAALEQSVSGLTAIREHASGIGARIGQLSQSAQQIGGITLSVKDLADQSNMLALNAAIEAVRSGEHGKGFAVVAREIRSLADQSIEATRRVEEILGEVSGSITSAVTMAESGTRKMEEGLTAVRTTEERLRELLVLTRRSGESARQIAAAVAQQNAGISQIFAAVTDQMAMMEQTRQRLGKTHDASAAIREDAVRISEFLARYRI